MLEASRRSECQAASGDDLVDLAWLRTRVAQAKIDLDAVTDRGGGAWLFGSRACSLSKADSDWDVLVVVPGLAPPRLQVRQLDIVSVSVADLKMVWPKMELATHVAQFGVLLAGSLALPKRLSPRAAAPWKLKVVRQRATRLAALWPLLRRPERAVETLRLRRDLQRATRLATGLAVPATAVLDAEWAVLPVDGRSELLSRFRTPPRLERALSTA